MANTLRLPRRSTPRSNQPCRLTSNADPSNRRPRALPRTAVGASNPSLSASACVRGSFPTSRHSTVATSPRGIGRQGTVVTPSRSARCNLSGPPVMARGRMPHFNVNTELRKTLKAADA